MAKQNPRIAGGMSSTDGGVDGENFDAATEYALTHQARGLHINTAGDVYVDFVGMDGRTAGTNVKFTFVAGDRPGIWITKIYSTTTATGVILY